MLSKGSRSIRSMRALFLKEANLCRFLGEASPLAASPRTCVLPKDGLPPEGRASFGNLHLRRLSERSSGNGRGRTLFRKHAVCEKVRACRETRDGTTVHEGCTSDLKVRSEESACSERRGTFRCKATRFMSF